MSGDDVEPGEGRVRAALRRSDIVPAVAVALAVGALACLGYAWLRRTPGHPFVADREAVTEVLHSTSAVVAAMVAVLVAYVVFRWAKNRFDSEADGQRRLDLVKLLSPTLALIALVGIATLHLGGTAEIFDRAAWQQEGLRSTGVTEFAYVAWWCACLAVLTIALVASLGDVAVGRPKVRACASTVLAGSLTLLLVAAVLVLVQRPMLESQRADAMDVPPPPSLTGNVVYRIDGASDGVFTTDRLLAGGPGFIRPKDLRRDSDGVEGFDGATGQRRWSFSHPELSVQSFGVTDGTVVVSGIFHGYGVLIGIDADTGAPLWTVPGLLELRSGLDGVAAGSTGVLLATEEMRDTPQSSRLSTRWLAIDARTGKTLWDKTFPAECRTSLALTKSAVVMQTCENPGGDVLATALDARSGEATALLTGATLSVDAGGLEWSPGLSHDEGSDLVVFTFDPPGSPGASTTIARAVDVPSGRVTPLPDGTRTAVVGPSSLLLSGPATYSILDLATGVTTETGVATDVDSDALVDGSGELWADVDGRWVTSLPVAGGGPELKEFAPGAPLRVLADPCTGPRQIPRLTSVPGALLVNCGDQLVAFG